MMLAHYHGQIFNASEIGQSIGVTYNTSIRYLDILSGTFMMRRLAPWYENIGKRQVKSPKVYFRDSGLFHTLLNIESKTQLMSHPKLGCSGKVWL
jgi:predicted AAA+ superfamily ATPase